MTLLAESVKKTPFVCRNSNEDYHTGPGLSNSAISMILDCPYKYWDNYLNPDKPDKEVTASLQFGTMLHCFLLEQEEFEKRYLVIPKTRRGTKAWAEFETNAAGREMITTEEMDRLYKIQQAINEHKTAKLLLKGGHPEQSIYWHDLVTDVLCKSRPDYMTNDYIVDIKTTRCASEKEFQKSIVNYGYHRQAAIALDGRAAISGISDNNFINLCIESERPYVVSVFVLSDEAIQQGRSEYRRGLEIYKNCVATNTWPQYVEEVEEISLPAWARKEPVGETYE